MKNTNLPDYDVAIIGGGASGLWTAWRMLLEGGEYSERLQLWKKERGSLKIAIFEGSDRIGGRVLSAKAPGLPNVVCEIGGMRYVTSQYLVRSLVENKFKMPWHQQAVGESKNLAYLRAKRMRQSSLDNPEVLPYKFNDEENEWLEMGNSADNFLGYAVEKIFPEIAAQQLSGEELRAWLRKQKIDGTPLHEIGFWNLIAPVLSHEAYRVAVTTVGYDCLGFNFNAVDTICELFDFTPGVEYRLINDGYDAMLWQMQKEFEQAGGEVYTKRWLKGFDNTTLSDGTVGVTMEFKKEKTPTTARAIVLAMPQRSLNLLERKGPVLDPDRAPHVQFMINSVSPVQLYKMFIAYDTPWWEKTNNVTQGRSVTDIPIRQCYYWGKEEQPDNDNAILMVYNDAESSTFWGGLRHIPLGPNDTRVRNGDMGHRLFKRKPMPFAKAKITDHDPWDQKLRENWDRSVAPKQMVEEMHRQLKIMHNAPDAPEPLEAAFKDWGDDPYGGAVHFWNPGYDSSKILHEIIQPVKSFPCYICGEAYSTGQTWVEGAFQTAELVLKKFDIPTPTWVKEEQPLLQES